MSHAMTRSEREEFLADLHVGVIGLVDGDRPLAVPIWYSYETGGDVWIITSPDSVKGRALEATGRFSLCAQTEDAPYRYVSVEGPVTSVEECPHSAHVEMAHRYLGPELGDLYVASTAEANQGSRIYRMSPETWRTVDYAKDLG